MIALIAFTATLSVGCGGSVVPCAWVEFKSDLLVVYTSNMYASGGEHIYLYESEELAQNDKYHTEQSLSVTFYPRILGADTVDGRKTTIVDISKYSDMTVYVYKDKTLYSPEKSIYLNGSKLTPTNVNDLDLIYALHFEDVPLERGNPNGSINGKVNVIEYK